MAASNAGFTIPARIVVTVEGLTEVRRQMQKFASDAKLAGEAGQPLTRVKGGAAASVNEVRRATGAQLNDARQAAALARAEAARPDTSKRRRQELEGEVQALKKAEEQIKRYTAAHRTEGGKVLPPIYPAGELRFPSIAAQERGAQPKLPPRGESKRMPTIPERAPEPPAPEPPPPRKRASRVVTRKVAPKLQEEETAEDRAARAHAEEQAQLRTNAAFLRQAQTREAEERRAERIARRRADTARAQAVAEENQNKKAKAAADASKKKAAEPPLGSAAEKADAQSRRVQESWIKPKKAAVSPPAAAAPPPPPKKPPTAPPPSEEPPEPPPKKKRKRPPRGDDSLFEDDTPAKPERGSAEARYIKATEELARIRGMSSPRGQEALAAEQDLARERAKAKAAVAEARAGDIEYLKSVAAESNARRDEANRIKMFQAGRDPGDLTGANLKARLALAEREQADRAKASATRQATKNEIDASAQLLVSTRLHDQKVKQREAEIVKQGVKSGDIPRGTFFQRLQSSLQPASGRLPEENLKALQFVGDKLQRSLGYAASGLLIGMGATAIAELYKDATELEVTFVRLRGQLEGIGRTDAFDGIRNGIRDVAAATGQASVSVAAVFTRLVGMNNDPAKALTETASAMKLMTVTGLDVSSLLSSIVPISKSFQVSVEEIGNSVVEMGEKFGISEDDLLQFLGKTAVVAKQAGLNLDELTIIGGTMANSLGKPIEASSEAINKVTGQLEVNMQKIFQILQSNPKTEGAISKMIGSFSEGKPGQALIDLLKVVDQFDPSQRNQILKNVVSRREAEDFNAIITNASSILQQLQDKETGVSDNTGRLNKRFGDLKQTVQVAFQSINAAFESMGELLLRSGMGDALKDISNLLGMLVGSIGAVVSAFSTLNDTIGFLGVDHLMSGFMRIATVMGIVTLAVSKLSQAQQAGVVVNTEEATSEAANTVEKERNATVTEGAAVAQTNLNRARAAGAAALFGPGVLEAGPVGVGGEVTQPLSAARQAELAASAGALTATGRGARLARSLPRMGANYTSQYNNYMAALAGMGESEIPAMTLSQKALAGGKFLRVPAANALADTTGAATGLMASPLLTGALVLVLAAYAKTQYDELKRNAESAQEGLQVQFRQATVENVHKYAKYESSLGERFIAAITGTETIEHIAQGEEASIATPAMRRMTSVARPERKKLPLDDTKKYLETTQATLNEQYASQYSDALKSDLQEQLLNAPDELARMGADAGVLEEVPWWKRAMFDFSGGSKNAYKRNEGAGPAQYARLREALRQYRSTPGAKEEVKVGEMEKSIDEAESKMTNVPQLDAMAQTLLKGKNAVGAIEAAGGDVGVAWNQMSVWGDTQFKSLNELQNMLESGEISQVEYTQGVNEAVTHLKDAGTHLQGTEAEAARVATRDALKKGEDVRKAALMKLNDVATSVAASGSLTPKTLTRDMTQAVIANLPRRDRLDALPQMLQQDMAAQEEIIQAIGNPEERLAALNRGIQLSGLTKTTYLTALTQTDIPASGALKMLAEKSGKDAEDMGESIAKISAEMNISMQDAAAQYFDSLIKYYEDMVIKLASIGLVQEAATMNIKVGEIKKMRDSFVAGFAGVALPKTEPTTEQKQINDIEKQAKLDEAQTAKSMGQTAGNTLAQASLKARAAQRALERTRRARAVKDSKTTDEDVLAAEGAAAEAAISEADAWFSYAQLKRQRQVILANRDPVLETAAKMASAVAARDRAAAMGRLDQQEQAEQEILQLQQEAAENQLNIARGYMAIQSAIDAEDPLKSAVDALKAAELELANAHGDADRRQKQAQVIQAQQALANAVSAGISADVELAISLANLSDDPVKAADLALQEAHRKLDEARSKNITDRTVLAPLEEQIAQAAKEAFLAPINKQISDLDYLYALEQISLGDYIAMLEQQLSALVYDSKEYRELNMKIYNLKKSASADLSWSLPGNLELPTLYETRRAAQTIFNTPSSPYQDNRNVQVNIAVNGAQDPMAVALQVQTALNDSLRGGQTYTSGIPLAAGI